MKNIPPEWHEYRRRHNRAVLGLLGGLPVTMLLVILIGKVQPAFFHAAMVIAPTVWAVLWGWAAFQLVRWPCPRCGRAWLSNQEPVLGGNRCCVGCGLSLFEKSLVTPHPLRDS